MAATEASASALASASDAGSAGRLGAKPAEAPGPDPCGAMLRIRAASSAIAAALSAAVP
ncbi:hypothetical protein [Streptomyces sp. 1114.5]|uniref:hypothetical protein n=1 Tax=Streptomyces sp. 1114.5 TaxID=1938830 RepID=UPI00217ED838|nr:hypothetical protein [Streptomyces sp. 1114.5]